MKVIKGNSRYKFLWLLHISLLVAITAFAQPQQDVQLAQEYFKNGEYDKAASMYEKILNKSPGNPLFFSNYIQSLTALKKYDEAEKVIKKQIKRFPDDLTYFVDLGRR